MIDNLMIVVIVLYTLIVFTLGVVYGQHSVWTYLRKKGHVIIDEWYYTAVKINKRWN